jgi:hypothetical protein
MYSPDERIDYAIRGNPESYHEKSNPNKLPESLLLTDMFNMN